MALEQVSTFVLPNEYQRQATEARRRRRMAEMLAQQAYQPSDISAPIPAAAPLVQGLQAFLAARAERKADEAEEAAKETASREARQYLKALTEEDTTTDATQPEGPTAPPTVTMPQFEGERIMAPASIEMGAPPSMVAPQVQLSRYNLTPGQRRAAALEGMLSSQNPMIQNIGSTIYPTLQPEKTKLQIGPVNLSDLTPESARRFAASGKPEDIVYAAQPAKAPTTVGGMMWDAERGFVEIPGYSAQQGAIAAAKRPDVVVTGGREKLVPVMGPDGKPKFVRESEAEGMMPFTARTAADVAAEEARERSDRMTAVETGNTLSGLAALINHPGRKAATGGSYKLSQIPGTDAYGFRAKLETFKSQTFLPMVKNLVGMGALSNAEGQKLTDAVGALDLGMKEDEFINEMIRIGNYLYDKAAAAGLTIELPPEFGKRAATSIPPGFDLE